MRGKRPAAWQLWAAFAAVAFWSLAAPDLAQTTGSHATRAEAEAVQAQIAVQSNLVVLPVFVINKARMGEDTAADERCATEDDKVLSHLPPAQPFEFKPCGEDTVPGLTAASFHVLQDGIPQEIWRVIPEGWWLPTRDDESWHAAIAVTPSGIWSSTDLGGVVAGPWVLEEFYGLAYVPTDSSPGCHRIKMTVDVRGTRIFAPRQYCTGQTPSDPLNGTKDGEQLETDLTSDRKAKLPLALQAGFVYAGAGVARVDVTLKFPWNHLNHHWNISNWTLWARVGVLGTVYANDGAPVACFSDLLYPPYWPTFIRGLATFAHNQEIALLGAEESPNGSAPVVDVPRMLSRHDPAWLPTRYETQLDLPPGSYTLKVVLSDQEKFGRAEAPLVIDKYDGKGLALSSVMLCKRFRPAKVAELEAKAENFAPQYVPLVSGGLRFTPTADTSFRKDDPTFTYDPARLHKDEPMMAYFEIYEPLASGQPAGPVEAQARVVGAKNGKVVKLFPAVHVTEKPQARNGFWAVPVALKIPYEQFPKAAYRLEVHAIDSTGATTTWRAADFTVE